MARQWTVKEIVQAVVDNNTEELRELAKRYPMLTVALAKADARGAIGVMDAIPSYVTPLSMERALNGTGAATADEEPAEEEPVPQEEPAEETKEERKRRIDRERQQRKRAKDKAAEESKKEVEELDDDEGGPTTGKYDEISAVELFKMCKKRGLSAQPKKQQRFYIDLLEAADAEEAKKAAADEEDGGEEDWGDEAPEKETSAKGNGKSGKGAKSSSSKKAAEEDEEEEDWNI